MQVANLLQTQANSASYPVAFELEDHRTVALAVVCGNPHTKKPTRSV